MFYITSYDNVEEPTMNKTQFFAVLMLMVLGLVIVSIVVFDSDASIEMQQCGGCHNAECTQEMAGAGTWPLVFNAIVPEHRGERAVPCTEGYLRGCTDSDCHTSVHKSEQLHEGMISAECTRCHATPTAPMYSECTVCHANYQHANTIEGDCRSCHTAHSADTSAGCGDCHASEYTDLMDSGGKHAAKDTSYDALRYKLSPTTFDYETPLIGDGCYSCHVEHAESMDCLECHEVEHGYELADCMTCHNPHAPRTIKFGAIVTSEQCMLCHEDTEQEFTTHPTRHAELNCTECHIEHTGARACVDCHSDAHKDIVVDTDCMTCHTNGHAPI